MVFWNFSGPDAAVITVDLVFLSKVAVKSPEGRIAVQDQVSKSVVWVDDPDIIKQRVARTLGVSSKKEIAFSVFNVEKDILNTRFGSPHWIGGQTFWEWRCLKPCLTIDYGDDEFEESWTKRNLNNVRAKLSKAYKSAGGLHDSSHCFQSQKYWAFVQACVFC